MSSLALTLMLVAQAAAPGPDPLALKMTDAEITDPARTSKTRIAVMGLGTAGAPADYAEGLTETIATTTQETGVFEVVSPRQIASLLAYEKRKELLGGCVEDACYVQIAQTVRAEHLIAGSVAKVGANLVLNLVLIDAAEGKALKRTHREAKTATELLQYAKEAAIILLQPVLSARQGYLKVAANVPDASLVIDDELRSEGVGQVVRLAAGPHLLKVKREGFYSASADVFVRPGRVGVEEVKLIPAKETVESYESSATLMRYAAYATAVVAVGAGATAGYFYSQASDDKNVVDTYAAALDSQRDPSRYAEVLAAQDSFTTNQALYLSLLATAVVSGGASLVLFLVGDDPDRYEEFHSLGQ